MQIGNNEFLNLDDIRIKLGVNIEELLEVLNNKQIRYLSLSKGIYILESEFLKLFKEQNESIDIPNKVYPITEKEIIEATIKILSHREKISIKELREYLKETMNLTEEDLVINKNRKDTKFDQKVRNLISHRSSNGLLSYCDYENGYLKLKKGE